MSREHSPLIKLALAEAYAAEAAESRRKGDLSNAVIAERKAKVIFDELRLLNAPLPERRVMSRTVKQIQADIDEINRIQPKNQTWQEQRELRKLAREMDLARNPSADPFIRQLEASRVKP